MSSEIRNGVQYALYLMAIRHPEDFEEAERFVGGMLTEDKQAIRRANALIAKAFVVGINDSSRAEMIHILRPYFEEAYPEKPIVSSGLAGIAARDILGLLRDRARGAVGPEG